MDLAEGGPAEVVRGLVQPGELSQVLVGGHTAASVLPRLQDAAQGHPQGCPGAGQAVGAGVWDLSVHRFWQ